MKKQKTNKHAYIIMAHNKFDILYELLKDLDDERNNIKILHRRLVNDFFVKYIVFTFSSCRIANRRNLRIGSII